MNIEADRGIAATALINNLKTGTGNSHAGISAVEPVGGIDDPWEAHLTSSERTTQENSSCSEDHMRSRL